MSHVLACEGRSIGNVATCGTFLYTVSYNDSSLLCTMSCTSRSKYNSHFFALVQALEATSTETVNVEAFEEMRRKLHTNTRILKASPDDDNGSSDMELSDLVAQFIATARTGATLENSGIMIRMFAFEAVVEVGEFAGIPGLAGGMDLLGVIFNFFSEELISAF